MGESSCSGSTQSLLSSHDDSFSSANRLGLPRTDQVPNLLSIHPPAKPSPREQSPQPATPPRQGSATEKTTMVAWDKGAVPKADFWVDRYAVQYLKHLQSPELKKSPYHSTLIRNFEKLGLSKSPAEKMNMFALACGISSIDPSFFNPLPRPDPALGPSNTEENSHIPDTDLPLAPLERPEPENESARGDASASLQKNIPVVETVVQELGSGDEEIEYRTFVLV